MMSVRGIRPTVLLAGLLLAGGIGSAGEKKLMHCFFYTPIAAATQADWDAFYKATDELPSKIPGLSKVWVGKLRRPYLEREHGVCMEMDNEETLKAYASHPAHDAWVKVYEKVREPGTTTFDIIGR